MHHSAMGASATTWISIAPGNPPKSGSSYPGEWDQHGAASRARRPAPSSSRGRAASSSSSTRSDPALVEGQPLWFTRVVNATSASQWITSSGTSRRHGSRSGMPFHTRAAARQTLRGHAGADACSRYQAIVRSRPGAKARVRPEAEALGRLRRVEQPPRLAVRLRRVPADSALEAREVRDERCEVADGISSHPIRGSRDPGRRSVRRRARCPRRSPRRRGTPAWASRRPIGQPPRGSPASCGSAPGRCEVSRSKLSRGP